MASRVYKTGTIVTRVRNLLNTGVLKQPPLWLGVVEAFPPILEPRSDRLSVKGIPSLISYPEDQHRSDSDKYALLFEAGHSSHTSKWLDITYEQPMDSEQQPVLAKTQEPTKEETLEELLKIFKPKNKHNQTQ